MNSRYSDKVMGLFDNVRLVPDPGSINDGVDLMLPDLRETLANAFLKSVGPPAGGQSPSLYFWESGKEIVRRRDKYEDELDPI